MSASGSINQSQVDGPNLRKLVCGKVEDRISSLPDELRTNIISRLPFRHALKTCILSRSWKQIFSSLPNLTLSEFEFLDVPNLSNRFASLIDWTLANHDSSDIFSLDIHVNFLEQPHLTLKNTWINFAVEHNAQNLRLIAKIDETAGLPGSLFTCRSLRVFHLEARVQLLKLPSAIYLPNLIKMSLESVCFPDDTLTEKLFTGCPLLVYLSIRNCSVFPLTKLKISCPRLKTLWIADCDGINACILNLQGTCIEHLFYFGTLAQNFEFGNMSRLVTGTFNLTRDRNDERNHTERAPVAWNILRELTHARKLTLGALFYKALIQLRQELWQLRCFKNLASMRLFLWPSAENEEMVMTLLSKLSYLRTLKIFISRRPVFEDTYRMELNPEKYRLEGIFEHLKYLEIDNFEGFALEMGFLMFILKNAKSLTRVTIVTPRATITHYGEHALGSRVNRTLEQEINHKLGPLRIAYPTVTIRVMEKS